MERKSKLIKTSGLAHTIRKSTDFTKGTCISKTPLVTKIQYPSYHDSTSRYIPIYKDGILHHLPLLQPSVTIFLANFPVRLRAHPLLKLHPVYTNMSQDFHRVTIISWVCSNSPFIMFSVTLPASLQIPSPVSYQYTHTYTSYA